MSSLLEEAIVDAKALKEAALKNAENAVLEKYSTEVKSAIDTLLEQDLGEDLSETEETDHDELMEFVDEVPYAFQNEEIDAPAVDEIIEIDFDSLKTRLDEEEEVVEGDDLTDATALADEIALEEGNELVDTEDEMMKDSAGEAEAEAEPDEHVQTESDDEEITLSEEMLSDLIEELVVDMVPRPQGWSSVNSADSSIEQANNDAMAAAQAAHLEEEEEIEKVSTAPDVVSDAELFESKISNLTESNKELRALLTEAKNQLTKLNLANAKLVYQNKALNSASLNERQKDKIVEAVQSANSVEEANMIFETIQNAVGSTPDQRTRPQTLREAVQRPTSLLINSKKNKKATKDPNMDRMLRLAGLNK
tara:strand:- start:19395 stop:20489 length:1095 start_codon:yes stop_codon:yes gene_type:complete